MDQRSESAITYTVTNNEPEKQLEIHLDGDMAYLIYRFYKKDIVFMHTVVPAALEGKGLANALAVAAFGLAKELKRPVGIYCPFVKEFIGKHPEYKSQLDPTFDNEH